MKKGMTVFFMGIFCLIFLKMDTVYAAPASELLRNIEVSQPSGERFTVSTKGDEHFNYTIAGEEAEIVIQEKDKYWYYGKFSTDNSFIESTGMKYLLDKKPNKTLKESDLSQMNRYQNVKPSMIESNIQSGNIEKNQNVLVVLVEFSNVKLNDYTTEPRSIPEWSSTFFSQEENAISVANYYKETTGDRITIQPAQTTQYRDAPGIVKVTLDSEHPNPQNDVNLPERNYFSDILTKVTTYIDLNQYDTNKDKQLSKNELHVCFVFAGRDASMSYGENAIWGYNDHKGLAAPDGLTFSTGYMVTGELTNTWTRFSSREVPSTIGLLAHEFGHQLGLPDLYNKTEYREEGGYGLGEHSLMSSGSQDHLEGDLNDPKNYAGNSPAHLDAYSKIYLGIPVEIVDSEKEIEIKSITSHDSKVYKIKTNTENSEEYYLLENRPYEKFDRGRINSKSSGLAVYYVNEKYAQDGNYLTSKYGNQLVTLIEADENKTGSPKLLKSKTTGSNSYFNNNNLLFNKNSSQTIIHEQNSPEFDTTIEELSNESIKVKFSKPEILVQTISLEQENFSMDIGQTETLKANVTPENATNQELEWNSSNPAIVSVDEKGVVSANSSGVVTITVKVKNTDKSASVSITVKPVHGEFGSVKWEWEDETQTVRFISEGTFSSTSNNRNLSTRIENNKKLNGKKIKRIVFEKPVKLSNDSSHLFYKLEQLETIEGVSNLDVSEVTNMNSMFKMTALKQLNLSNWDTSKVTTMNNMFGTVKTLKQLDLSKWNTSNVTDMGYMFYEATSLQQLNVSNWDTSKVTNMNSMFLHALVDQITLGSKSLFKSNVYLEERTSIPYTGFWMNNKDKDVYYKSSEEFMTNYNGSNPGTYIREIKK